MTHKTLHPQLSSCCLHVGLDENVVHVVVVQRIMGVKYSFPANLALSRECVDLISKIFQANPSNRISISGIRSHPWFLKNLPEELIDGGRAAQVRPLSAPVLRSLPNPVCSPHCAGGLPSNPAGHSLN